MLVNKSRREPEIKINVIYGDNSGNYFNKSFTLSEIEGGDHFDEISDSLLLKDYKIITKRLSLELTDSKDNEIYSGDIIKKDGVFYYIEYMGGKYVATTGKGYDSRNAFDFTEDEAYFSVVIGNIYENNNTSTID